MTLIEQEISQNILIQKTFQQALYTDFFGIAENPFSLTPDPKYFYLSSKHKEALAHLYFGLKEKQGFIAITGEVGTGKTTLCRAFLEHLAPEYDVAYILNPCFTALELLHNIIREFGILTKGREGKKELLDTLNEFLLEKKRDNRTVIVIIDEAQNLEPEVLEQIRLISNLETTTEKLIQIVLIGQPELNKLLSTHSLRQLNQRILFRWHIDPLDFKETLLYIEHRLKIASVHSSVTFDTNALKAVFHHSGGIPRLINVLSHRALLVAFAHDKKRIDKKIIHKAAKDINTHQNITYQKSHTRNFKKTVFAFAMVFFMIIVSITSLSRDMVTVEKAENIISNIVNKPSASEILLSQLAEITEEESLTISNNRILSLWSSKSSSEGADLSLYDFSGTFEELKKFNLPSVVELKTHAGKRYLPLENIDNDNLVTSLKEQVTIPLKELEPLFSGSARIYWKDFEKLKSYLSPGDRGIQTEWLQLNLMELGFMKEKSTTVYDPQTLNAVIEFQKAHGLEPDGVVGPATKIFLYSQLQDTYSSPILIK